MGTDTTKSFAVGSVANTNIISDSATSGNGNIDTSATDDKNKISPGDSGNKSANQGSTGSSDCLHISFGSCVGLLYLHMLL